MGQEANSKLIAHQQGMDVEEKILRHFDLSSQYGVCCPGHREFSMEKKSSNMMSFSLALYWNCSCQALETG